MLKPRDFAILYNKILSYYFVALIIFFIAGSWFVGLGSWMIVLPLLFVLFGWLYFMVKGVRDRKKSSYYFNLIIHILIILYVLPTLFTPTISSIGFVGALFSTPALIIIILNTIVHILILGSSGYLVHSFFKTETKAMFDGKPPKKQKLP